MGKARDPTCYKPRSAQCTAFLYWRFDLLWGAADQSSIACLYYYVLLKWEAAGPICRVRSISKPAIAVMTKCPRCPTSAQVERAGPCHGLP